MSSSLSPHSAGRVTALDSEDFTTSESDSSDRPVRRSKRIATSKNKSSASKTASRNGLLVVPGSPEQNGRSGKDLRSPSPLGLIPIHSQFKGFIHRHEVPRKALHVSIGFVTLILYGKGFQKDQIHPALLGALIPVATVDLLRHRFPKFNRTYVQVLGALMRESEVDGYNGVIWYLAGTWVVMRFAPKDVATVSILLLSWCDTAASTFGRAFGQYTWRIRKGKSAAGTAAALVTGVLTAWVFWGWAVPTLGGVDWRTAPDPDMAFQGFLKLPEAVRGLLGWKESESIVRGNSAIGVLSLVTGIVASASEAVDIFNWDDNFTIPVLCGLGLFGFLKVFSPI